MRNQASINSELVATHHLKAFRRVYCAKYYSLAALRISHLVGKQSQTWFLRPFIVNCYFSQA